MEPSDTRTGKIDRDRWFLLTSPKCSWPRAVPSAANAPVHSIISPVSRSKQLSCQRQVMESSSPTSLSFSEHQVGAGIVDRMEPVRRTNEEEIELLEFDDLTRPDG